MNTERNYPTEKEVSDIINILFPHWNNFGNDKTNLIVHHGAYDKYGERHADSIYTIQFKKPTKTTVEITIRFWDKGLQIWETEKESSKVQGNTEQFNLYRYLKSKNLLLIEKL